MSRHGFFKVLHDPTEAQEDLTDLVGYDLYDWLSHGVAGYDEAMGTFFFNLEGSWIFGVEGEEIPTIGMLQAILSAIFRGAELPFNQEGLRASQKRSRALLPCSRRQRPRTCPTVSRHRILRSGSRWPTTSAASPRRPP